MRIVQDGTFPNGHRWAIGQQGRNGHTGDTVAFIEESALSGRTLCQCWVAAQALLSSVGEDDR